MKKLSLLGMIVVLVSILVVPTVYASIIYDNGAPNQVNGNEMTNWIQAEDFQLSSNQTINEVKFWAIAYPAAAYPGPAGYAGDINYFIYADNSGSPAGLLTSGNVTTTAVATGITGIVGSFSEYLLDFNIPGFNAIAGTTYWLGLHNGDLNNTNRSEFYWETTNTNVTSTGNEMYLPGSTWYDNGQEHAFQLLGGAQVPEPATMLLLGLGLIGVAGIRRKFKG